MGTTAKGYPYPDPGDSVANTDLAIKALADFLNNNGFKAMHAGSQVVTVPNGATSAGSAAPLVFPAGKFSAIPIVVAVVQGTSSYHVAVGATTAAQVSFTVRHIDATAAAGAQNVTVWFVAVQLA